MDKQGWPYTNSVSPEIYSCQIRWPKISIVTPSYNQGQYIEETILSVLNQNYPNLEYIIIDGGSIDDTIEIIKKYEDKITYWTSEKDNGQSDAINKGFRKATGEWIAWMNSDDCYLPGAFEYIFSNKNIADYDFIYGPVNIGTKITKSKPLKSQKTKLLPPNLLKFFYSVDYIVPSQSVFIKRNFLIKNNMGFLNENLHYCMDMEWYLRIAFARPNAYRCAKAFSFFRINEMTKTGSSYHKMQTESIQIMYDNLSKLTFKNQKYLLDSLFLHRILHRIWSKKQRNSTCLLLYLFKKIPIQSFQDRRFWGLLKQSLLKWFTLL